MGTGKSKLRDQTHFYMCLVGNFTKLFCNNEIERLQIVVLVWVLFKGEGENVMQENKK